MRVQNGLRVNLRSLSIRMIASHMMWWRPFLKIHKKHDNHHDLCGYTFLRAFPDGKINGIKFNTDEMITPI